MRRALCCVLVTARGAALFDSRRSIFFDAIIGDDADKTTCSSRIEKLLGRVIGRDWAHRGARVCGVVVSVSFGNCAPLIPFNASREPINMSSQSSCNVVACVLVSTKLVM